VPPENVHGRRRVFAAVGLGNSSEKPHKAHGLFVLVPCTCGQQSNVRPEDRFQRGRATFGCFRDERKKVPGSLCASNVKGDFRRLILRRA
jgi:hypothetical protein